MTVRHSIPLAHGLLLAGNRYMTLLADISHVFGKKVHRSPLPSSFYFTRVLRARRA
jgi:hypothetical protein